MYQGKLRLGYSRFKTADLSSFTANVIKMMRGNINFTELQDKVNILEEAYNNFLQSILPPEAQNQITRDQLAMNRRKLVTQLKSLGNLIMGESEGDIEKLLTTGYKLSEKPTHRPVPNQPTELEIFMTNTEGVIIVMCKKDSNADSYIARVSIDKVNWNWSNFENGKKVMVENVPLNIPIFVQMQAKNPAGRSDWSNPIETYLPSKNIPMMKKINVSTSLV
jgi:hypothetical protein